MTDRASNNSCYFRQAETLAKGGCLNTRGSQYEIALGSVKRLFDKINLLDMTGVTG